MGEFSFFHILILLLLFVPILFGRRILHGGSGIQGLPYTTSVSSPSNAASRVSLTRCGSFRMPSMRSTTR